MVATGGRLADGGGRVVFGGIFGTQYTGKSGKTRASRETARKRRRNRRKDAPARIHWGLIAKTPYFTGANGNHYPRPLKLWYKIQARVNKGARRARLVFSGICARRDMP
jgi:hypothetical protein